jgi:hypothetical protein
MDTCSNRIHAEADACPDNWVNEIPSYKLPLTAELYEKLKHLTEPRQQRVANVFLNILDCAAAVVEAAKTFPPQRRFMRKKNRTPKGRIDRMIVKAKMNRLLQMYLAKHTRIVSTPIPKFPLGTKLSYGPAIVGDGNREVIIPKQPGVKYFINGTEINPPKYDL